MSKKGTIKVKVRVEAARAAGRWFADTLAKHPGSEAEFGPAVVKFFTVKLARRSSPTVELDRAFADALVRLWRGLFKIAGRNDLRFSVSPATERGPVVGIEAVAEIINDIGAALHAPEGRALTVDPLEAVEAIERAKAGRVRGQTVRAADVAAERLGVGRTQLEKAAAKGRPMMDLIAALSASGAKGSKKVP